MFELSDSYVLDIKLKDLLVNGTDIDDLTDARCYIPVFRSEDTAQDTWYLGNIVMQFYYIVFDMTPVDERSEDYL